MNTENILNDDIVKQLNIKHRINKEIIVNSAGQYSMIYKDHLYKYEFFTNSLYINQDMLNHILKLTQKDHFFIRNIKKYNYKNIYKVIKIEKVVNEYDQEIEFKVKKNSLIIDPHINKENIKLYKLYLGVFNEDIVFKKTFAQFYEITNLKIITYYDIY